MSCSGVSVVQWSVQPANILRCLLLDLLKQVCCGAHATRAMEGDRDALYHLTRSLLSVLETDRVQQQRNQLQQQQQQQYMLFQQQQLMQMTLVRRCAALPWLSNTPLIRNQSFLYLFLGPHDNTLHPCTSLANRICTSDCVWVAMLWSNHFHVNLSTYGLYGAH